MISMDPLIVFCLFAMYDMRCTFIVMRLLAGILFMQTVFTLSRGRRENYIELLFQMSKSVLEHMKDVYQRRRRQEYENNNEKTMENGVKSLVVFCSVKYQG